MYDKDVINRLKNIPDNLKDTLGNINREIGYGTKIIRESRDDNGVYTVIKEYNAENILTKISTLLEADENGNYLVQTIEYYRENGMLDFVETFNLIYDEDSRIVGIEKRGEENE